MRQKVLVACEFSGVVRRAFRRQGYDAWSCDILPAEDGSKYHIQGDVMDVLDDGWDLMIAHPPCTYLANSGVSWLYRQEGRWDSMKEGAQFFKSLLNADIPQIAIENPIMHKCAKEIIGKDKTQVIQPWMFGHSEQKATCLWLKNLPVLQETHNVKEEMLALPDNQRQRLHHLPPSKNRWKLRSKTFEGIAEAMAEQWGKSLLMEAKA